MYVKFTEKLPINPPKCSCNYPITKITHSSEEVPHTTICLNKNFFKKNLSAAHRSLKALEVRKNSLEKKCCWILATRRHYHQEIFQIFENSPKFGTKILAEAVWPKSWSFATEDLFFTKVVYSGLEEDEISELGIHVPEQPPIIKPSLVIGQKCITKHKIGLEKLKF